MIASEALRTRIIQKNKKEHSWQPPNYKNMWFTMTGLEPITFWLFPYVVTTIPKCCPHLKRSASSRYINTKTWNWPPMPVTDHDKGILVSGNTLCTCQFTFNVRDTEDYVSSCKLITLIIATLSVSLMPKFVMTTQISQQLAVLLATSQRSFSQRYLEYKSRLWKWNFQQKTRQQHQEICEWRFLL